MKRILSLAVATVVLALSACKPAAQAEAQALGPAPAWKLQNLEGREVSSADFAGKVVVIDFWATWCPPCRAEIPGYIELQNKYKDAGLVIVGISLDQAGVDVVRKFAAEYKINYPIVMGDAGIAESFGGVEGIPTTFVIDRTGTIRHKKVGAESTAAFEKRIQPLLEARTS